MVALHTTSAPLVTYDDGCSTVHNNNNNNRRLVTLALCMAVAYHGLAEMDHAGSQARAISDVIFNYYRFKLQCRTPLSNALRSEWPFIIIEGDGPLCGPAVGVTVLLIIIIKGHSLRRACLQPPVTVLLSVWKT